MTTVSTVVQCRCGSCRMSLGDPEPRFRVECLCYDCRQRVLIAASRRIGNEVPDAVLSYGRGVDLLYYSNALVVDDASRRLLEFSMLREDANNVTAMSLCCQTIMCGAHPAFQRTTIWLTPDSCIVTPPPAMAPRSYLFACDFPPDKIALLPRRDTIPTVFSVGDEIGGVPMTELFSAVTAPLAEQFAGPPFSTFEQLYVGRPIKIDDACFAASRSGAM